MALNQTGKVIPFRHYICNIKKHERSETFLEKVEHQFHILVEEALVGIYVIQDDHIIYANPKLREIFGYTEEEINRMNIYRIVFPEDHVKVKENIKKRIEGEIFKIQYKFRGVKKDNSLIHVEVLGSRIEYSGKPAVLGTLIDVTERKKSEEKLRIAQKVFENTIEGIAVTDIKGNIQFVNPAFTTITGYSQEEAIGKNPRILRSERHDKAFYENMWETITTEGYWQGEIWNRRKNGETYPEWLTISAIKNDHGQIVQYASVFHDISKQIKQEEHIRYQTYHDALTSLPNRFLFKDRLNSAIAHAQRHKEMITVLFLDIDRFKRINDTLSHAVGDKLLQAAAARLKECIKEDDTVSRFGGDEFGIILRDVHSIENMIRVVKRIMEILTKPFFLENHELYITASIGISLYPTDGTDAETLMRNADTAMYQAKEHGRNNYRLYTPKMNEKALTRLSMENNLYRALKQDEFILYYQPQIEVNTGKILGAEALIRWQHPQLGIVSPRDFIPLAEETGLIVPIGEWVLRKAFEQNNKWQKKGYMNIQIAVNLSALQFKQKNLIEKIASISEETGVSPKLLELEITESSTMIDPDFTNKMLHQLKTMGVKVAIDDFGTGYSSLAYLTKLPIDKIKIDQSFIRNIMKDKDSLAIVGAIMAMAKSLGLRITAEGVETREQLLCLKKQYCHEIQGYYFSPPVKAEDFEQLLSKGYMKIEIQ